MDCKNLNQVLASRHTCFYKKYISRHLLLFWGYLIIQIGKVLRHKLFNSLINNRFEEELPTAPTETQRANSFRNWPISTFLHNVKAIHSRHFLGSCEIPSDKYRIKITDWKLFQAISIKNKIKSWISSTEKPSVGSNLCSKRQLWN